MREAMSQAQMEKVRGFEKGFVATHLINIGSKLGLFEALNDAKDGITSSHLAEKLGLYEPYVRIWCQTAHHFEILDCDPHGRFQLQPFLDEILGDKSHFKNYLGNIGATIEIFGNLFGEFPEYFRTGKAMSEPYSPERSRVYYEATKNVNLVFQYMILPKNERLKEFLETGCSFLDIGCGAGSLIIKLAQTYDKCRFVGVDSNAYGIEQARKAIGLLGLEKRVSVENLGGEAIPYKDEFDVAAMVANIHEINPDTREKVLVKAHDALKSRGYLVLLDFPFPEESADFRNPLYDFAVLDQFRKTCYGHVHLSHFKRDRMLERAGFAEKQRRTIGKGMFELLIVEKDGRGAAK